jgi:hypothetical protein
LSDAKDSEAPILVDTSQWPESFVRNCLVVPREGDDLFFIHDGLAPRKHVLAMLDGYAIIPMEEYLGLTKALPEKTDQVEA